MAAVFHEAGVRHLITPVRSDGYEVVQHFLEEWTASTRRIDVGQLGNSQSGRHSIVEAAEIRRRFRRAATTIWTRESFIPASWLHDPAVQADSGRKIDYIFGSRPEMSLQFYFSGRSITYVYTKALNRGIAEVVIDGKTRARVDLYSKRQRGGSGKGAFRPGWRTGPQSLELRVTKRKNPKSSAISWIWINSWWSAD